MSSPVYDVLIIGAGIVGAACAAACAAEKMRVGIVEAEMIGGGTTAAGMGHLVVMDDSEAQFALTHYSRSLWNELSPQLPADVEYDRCGTIWIAAGEDEMRSVSTKHELYESRGVRAEILDAHSLHEAEPNLCDDLAGALLVPDDAVIYAPCAARFLVEQAQSRGAQLHLSCVVTELTSDGARLNNGSTLTARFTVLAGGAWSSTLLPGIAVKKRKGHLVITDRYPGFVRHQIVELGYLKSAHSLTEDSVAFNVQPRKTGQLLIGSSRQYDSDDTAIDHTILGRMLARAEQFMPKLSHLSAIRSWTGFRPATPDKLPLIGPAPGRENLFLATGHEGLGITTSLATAQLLVSQLLGRPSKIPTAPYLPSRVHEAVHA